MSNCVHRRRSTRRRQTQREQTSANDCNRPRQKVRTEYGEQMIPPGRLWSSVALTTIDGSAGGLTAQRGAADTPSGGGKDDTLAAPQLPTYWQAAITSS